MAPEVRKQTGHVFAIAVVFLVVAVAIQFWPHDPLPYRVGERAPTDLRAPVAFTMVNARQAEELRDETRKYSPSVLVADHTAAEAIYGQLNNMKMNVEGVRSAAEAPETVKAHFPALTDESLRRIQALSTSVFEADARALVGQKLATLPIISKEDAAAIQARHVSQVALTYGNALPESITMLETESVYPIGQADAAQQLRLRQAIQDSFPEGVTDVIASYFAQLSQPTFHYSAALTEAFAERRVAHMPEVGLPVTKDETIVHRGEVITELAYQELLEARRQLEHEVAAAHPWAPWAADFGRALIVAILTVAGALYVVRMNDVSRSPKQGWIVCGLLLLTLAPARVIVSYWPQTLYLVGMLPTLLVAVILTIAYSQRFALGLSAFHALLATVTLGQGMDFFFPLVAGAATFCFSLKEIRTLPRLFQVGFFYAAPAIFVSTLALGFVRMITFGTYELGNLGMEAVVGAAAAPIAAGVCLVALHYIEGIFNVTTSVTMLEWCDASKPLLRRLAQEASGTFNHSLTVGILAEAAGNAIGANGLLCRVGAYYHDVGKLSKPQYFIENQPTGGPNRHDKLSPAMSLLIIVGHVKDGIELAREYKLPHVVHQFIAQHHGTTLVEYFFHAARKKQEMLGEDAVEVSETEFRYPGPKPQTREAAIVMMCDACESTVRSIEEPTPGRIESAVHGIIMKRLMDGQFTECNLTMRDLSTIEETLIRTLAGVHHGRVAYPSAKPVEAKTA
ncbi:MAG: HD family phosphohydrolase [Phycisphaerae bacterium]